MRAILTAGEPDIIIYAWKMVTGNMYLYAVPMLNVA